MISLYDFQAKCGLEHKKINLSIDFYISMSEKFEQIRQWSLNDTRIRKLILPRLIKSTDN